MARPRLALVRLSAHGAASELGITTNKVKWALKAREISPGKDDRYSSKDIFTALTVDPLKAQAEQMRWEGVIAEAELKKLRVAEAKGELIHVDVVRKFVRDVFVSYVQRVKHFNLSKAEKEDLLNVINPDASAKDFKGRIQTGNNGA